MKSAYDVALLLAGENPYKRQRSQHAVDLYKKGRVGNIFITGGHGGLLESPLVPPETDRIAEYLLSHDVPEGRVFRDPRSFETLGNLTFPIVNPLPDNPSLKDISTLLVTEEAHMPRVLECHDLILPAQAAEYSASKGDYVPGKVTTMYQNALIRALRKRGVKTPEEAHQFLLEKHPFYQQGWYDKPFWKRKLILVTTCLSWTAEIV